MIRQVSGVLDYYFETGYEGVYWCLREKGKTGYEALNLLGARTNYLKITEKKTGGIVFEGHPVFMTSSLDIKLPKAILKAYNKLKDKIVPYGGTTRFSVDGMYFHHLPLAILFDTWIEIMHNSNDYIAEIEVKEDDAV